MLLCISKKNTKEKKQVFIKQQVLSETGISEAAFDTIDGDTTVVW